MTENLTKNVKLTNGIKNKLQGRAEEAVPIRGAKNCPKIKNILIQTFILFTK